MSIAKIMDNIWLPLITGLTSGGLSCFAVQGGLLTSALADQETGDVKYLKEKSILMFLVAKLIAYTILGALLGAIGSKIVISPTFQAWLQIFVGFYMLATAARLLDLHPIFRYFVITPPKFVLRFMRKISVSDSSLVPFFLGSLTVLIPCGVTQAMMLLAISSGASYMGASIMFFFILGTSPVFFLIGLAATTLLKNKAFAIIASIFILIMGILSINSGQILRGSIHTIQNYWKVISNSNQTQKTGSVVNIKVTNRGYESDVNTLKVGVPVTLNLITDSVTSCSLAFLIPSLNISKFLPSTGKTTITFTPTKLGNLTYTCSMGMYSGSFTVVN